MKGWDRYSPKGFIFNAKIPQTVTHDKLDQLGTGVESELDRFAELMQPLNNSGKLGCLLIQLPPRYKYNPNHLENFLSILPHGYRYAIEFRHKTWLQPTTLKILGKYNVSYTIVDEPLLPPDVHATADFAYLRWHGRGQRPWYDYHYTDQELEDWVPKVKDIQSSVKNVYGYFNNHFHGYAVENCLRILQMLVGLSADQEEALQRAQSHLCKGGERSFGLGKWLQEGESRSKIVDELASLLGEPRLARALSIPEEEVHIQSADKEKVEAKIRDYMLVMDGSKRTILHDCGDWERSLETHQLCKHVGRVLLSVKEDVALRWVSRLQSELERWKFLRPSDP